jgi:hypothetical protein
MPVASTLHRTLLIALASLALSAPAALARPADLRSEAPTSSLSGTSEERLGRSFGPLLAQERSFSTYGEPAPLTKPATTVAADTGDGMVPLPFVLAVLGALGVGLAAGSRLHLIHARRGHSARLAT